MHDALSAVASILRFDCKGRSGGANRFGGDTANGTPRYLFTEAVADGSHVVVPTITPMDAVTVGSHDCESAALLRTSAARLRTQAVSPNNVIFMMVV